LARHFVTSPSSLPRPPALRHFGPPGALAHPLAPNRPGLTTGVPLKIKLFPTIFYLLYITSFIRRSILNIIANYDIACLVDSWQILKIFLKEGDFSNDY
jgi:hypothetical protein